MGGIGSGNYTKAKLNYFDHACDLTLKHAAILIEDDSVPLLDRVRACLPLALKRIPDKHEVVQLTLNASSDDMKQLLDLASRNLEARQAIKSAHIVQPIVKQLDQATTSNDKQDQSNNSVDAG